MNNDIWKRIFKMPTYRETKIQTFQYRIIHHILPCKKWLINIKLNLK